MTGSADPAGFLTANGQLQSVTEFVWTCVNGVYKKIKLSVTILTNLCVKDVPYENDIFLIQCNVNHRNGQKPLFSGVGPAIQ